MDQLWGRGGDSGGGLLGELEPVTVPETDAALILILIGLFRLGGGASLLGGHL